MILLEFSTETEKQLERQIELAAMARGTNTQAFILEATRAALEAKTATGAVSGFAETPAERRARIRAAIDEAQKHFAPLMHGGDAVSQLMAEKRADVAREAERGF